jgi:hypothetical protein
VENTEEHISVHVERAAYLSADTDSSQPVGAKIDKLLLSRDISSCFGYPASGILDK